VVKILDGRISMQTSTLNNRMTFSVNNFQYTQSEYRAGVQPLQHQVYVSVKSGPHH
jgi:hypothetical protein